VRVLGHVARLSGAGHLAVRDGRWFEARLRETDLAPVDPPSLSPRASYLISGGSAETAAEFARRLGELGTRSLLLTGQPRPAAEPPQFAALRARGVSVRWCEQDVGALPPDVRGVIHLAEPPHDDQWLIELDPAKFRQLLDRQLSDAWRLHGAIGDTGFFVVSPDITALTGCAGHVGMLAAAAILDGMARHHPGGSTVARGPSAGTGTDTRFLAQGGIYPVDARRLADAMPWPLTGRPAPGGLARLDRDRLIAITGRSRPYTLLSTADEREGGTPGFGQHRMTAYRHNEESGRSGPD
jgi:hypothetical protein